MNDRHGKFPKAPPEMSNAAATSTDEMPIEAVRLATQLRLGQLGERILVLEQELRGIDLQRAAVAGALDCFRRFYELASVELLLSHEDGDSGTEPA